MFLKKYSVITLCLFFISGCNYNKPTNLIVNPVQSLNNLNVKKGASIKVSFSFNKNFSTKSSSGLKAKTITDVKSYDVFLTSNYSDPLKAGANPMGNNIVMKINAPQDSYNVNLIFSNIPSGGPYYAVIAAFDGTVDNPDRVNITQEDLTILSLNKKFARSQNSVVVNSDLTTNISDNKTFLEIPALQLQNEIPVKVDSVITLFDTPMPSISATLLP